VKLKHIFLILVMFIIPMDVSFSADFYPEMGMDPFYSSLNPVTDEKDELIKDDSIVDIIKNRKNNKKQEEQVVEQSVEDVVPEVEEKPISNEAFSDSSAEFSQTSAEKQVNFFKKIFKRDEKNVEKKKKEEHNIYDIPEEYLDDIEPETDDFEVKKKKSDEDLVKELEKEQAEKEQALTGVEKEKFSFLNIFKSKKSNSKIADEDAVSSSNIEITADNMEYFPDRYEVEAIGNAKVTFTKQDVSLSATKIIFNYDRNILKASENVVLISKDAITEGDFIRLDLSVPEGILENPITKTEDVILKAKEAKIYSDRIEEYDGVAKILKDEKLRLGSTSFAGYINQSFVGDDFNQDVQTQSSDLYSLKAKTIYIDAKDEHEVITIKNADLFYKKRRVASIPSVKVVTNKTRNNVEANLPEFGSMSLLGMHFGPAVVLNVPGGNTLKLAPIVTYSKDELGIGGIGRFRSVNNMTEAAYGTSRDQFLLRGKHKLAEGLTLNYSRLTSQSEWFLGYRKPKYSAFLNYRTNDYVKDLDLHFSQMFIAGAFVDDRANQHLEDVEGRFRWMTQTHKPIYKYRNEEGNISFSTGLVAQTAATVYTTGDVAGLFRFGPSLSTRVGPWKQSLIYLQTAVAGKMPFDFDRYRYGKSNILLIESLKVSKYLSLGYLASIAMNREVSSDDLFQENRFLVTIGPEYAKVTIGYDAFRRNTMFLFSMLVGTKDTDIEFKRSVIKNPNKFGKDKEKKKSKKKDYKKYLKEDVK